MKSAKCNTLFLKSINTLQLKKSTSVLEMKLYCYFIEDIVITEFVKISASPTFFIPRSGKKKGNKSGFLTFWHNN